MTLKPEMIYNIDYPAKGDSVDIGDRVNEGIRMAKADGFDLCFVIENDDAYPQDYFERFGNTDGYQFFGSQDTIYYHIFNRTWEITSHPGRSSLFTTGFRISALNGYTLPINTPFVDIALWGHSKGKKKFVNAGAIGIKGHGAGKMGGRGHIQVFPNKDPAFSWLKSHVDPVSFDFYMSLL
ncbi:MAG TPA: hypothetical protein VK462_04715 [Nitrososphaeraceae archaeon]|nr:hypothetical protein [Nitrososphaeraceae archaeon]